MLLGSAVLEGGVRFDLSSMDTNNMCLLTLASIMLYRTCFQITNKHAEADILKAHI